MSVLVTNPKKDIELEVQTFNKKVRLGEIQFEETACLCGSEKSHLLATEDMYGFDQKSVICEACGLVRLNPRMTEQELTNFYTSNFYRNIYDEKDLNSLFLDCMSKNYGRHIFEQLSKVLEINTNTKVMEFGAGGGWNLKSFIDNNASVVGYELNETLVKLGQNQGINLKQGGFNQISGTYDVIILNHVLEHLSDPIDGLKKLKLHLSPNGFLYVAVPNIINFCFGQIQNAHTFSFSPETFLYYTAQAGLNCEIIGEAEDTHLFGIFSNVIPKKVPPFPNPGLTMKAIYRYKKRQRIKNLLRKIYLDKAVAKILRKFHI